MVGIYDNHIQIHVQDLQVHDNSRVQSEDVERWAGFKQVDRGQRVASLHSQLALVIYKRWVPLSQTNVYR